ncbi:MAG: 30S ribosomal protein S4e [Candidatus Aenigmarchaeota archaeon]|nr:30S ribosomal protein S4e [Candidatus Aenigmarchaeota archaeon]NIQ17417.1 30S ribosomal protein S4e [Candidatus Aenigmarchaeota archaeon]
MFMHMKRFLIPKYWKMGKKEARYSVAPRAGPHRKDRCIPLLVVLRNVLKLSENAREAKKVIKSGEVLVDKKARKDPNYPLGMMDVLEIPSINKAFRVNVDRHGLVLEGIKPEEAKKKLCRVQNKRVIKGGRFQINLHDGRNILSEKDVYRTNDSLLIELPGQKVLKHFKFDRNSPALIISGKNIGVKGKIKDVFDRKTMLESSRVVLQTKDGEIETVKDYVLVGEIK